MAPRLLEFWRFFRAHAAHAARQALSGAHGLGGGAGFTRPFAASAVLPTHATSLVCCFPTSLTPPQCATCWLGPASSTPPPRSWACWRRTRTALTWCCWTALGWAWAYRWMRRRRCATGATPSCSASCHRSCTRRQTPQLAVLPPPSRRAMPAWRWTSRTAPRLAAGASLPSLWSSGRRQIRRGRASTSGRLPRAATRCACCAHCRCGGSWLVGGGMLSASLLRLALNTACLPLSPFLTAPQACAAGGQPGRGQDVAHCGHGQGRG